MSTETTTTSQPQPTAAELRASVFKHACNWIKEERSTLLAVTFALVNELEPDDPNDYDEHQLTTPWRLAQLLEKLLSSTAIESGLRDLLEEANRIKGD